MYNPLSTYRIQFHKDFTFTKFESVLAYLKELGIKTIYASPIFAAVPGSVHGYDGVNPQMVNPEIGTLEQLKEIIQKLHTDGISWLQDIVPNHMAFDQRNEWLMDLLEKGPQSLYATFFDTAWTNQLFKGKLMVPFLGSALEEVIDKGELKITIDLGRLFFDYYGNKYPLQPLSYQTVFESANIKRPESIEQFINQLPKPEEEHTYAQQWDEHRIQLAGLMNNEMIKNYIDNVLEQINGQKDIIRKIADEQSYRLCNWKETDSKINYRRFFTVNGLICINIQDENVFNTYHKLIRSLTEEGLFSGLRVDHIDGLYDPTQYLQRLRRIAGDETFIIVEKILAPAERLPKYWPVQGNTGYDFLALVNNLLTNKKAEPSFTAFYKETRYKYASLIEELHEKKLYILNNHMAGELDNLVRLFINSNLVEKRHFSNVRTSELREAIGEFLIHCPVYRYYGNKFPLQGTEYTAIQNIFNQIRRSTDLDRSVDILENAILKKPTEGDEERNLRALNFYQRCMQFTGPLMAKGMEDTLMYTFNRFIAHNDVGDSPELFGISIEDFHSAMKERQKRWPYSLNATSTHDTKRGEDVRARLNVLSDLPDQWFQIVQEWKNENEYLKKQNGPDANDEYFIYQTIAGAYPMPGTEDDFESRLLDYLQKAMRESKLHTNWTSPNENYEQTVKDFARSILQKDSAFQKRFSPFLQKIADFGIINSLIQLVLKFTCPGVPDTYQGSELWDLSLVDPDNRRPVDFEKRGQWLSEWKDSNPEELYKDLWDDRYSGKIKLWLTKQLLQLRNELAEVVSKGEYVPLKTEGIYKNNIIAFARKYHQNIIIVVVPLHIAQIAEEQKTNSQKIDWKDTKLLLPDGAGKDWTHLIWNNKDSHQKSIKVSHLFRQLPFALLKSELQKNERGAGILLHITSLASPFGIGDMGTEATAFANYLASTKQKYWQLLPLNPTEQGQGHSPYSSISSRAGNILLISPELLVKEGVLMHEDLKNYYLPQVDKTNYEEAEKVKNELFDLAWQNYKNGRGNQLKQGFESFRQKEIEWLNDFALYILLKKLEGGKPWYEWPEQYKNYDSVSLEELATENENEIEKTKWLQYIFQLQWKRLKNYCNDLCVRLIGDMPFYVSYDSADVWSHRDLFAIDEQGQRTGMAGVPPDAFSSDGQLWGMPVFKWDVLKENGYKWWVQRLKRNMELFDLVRLDHFRAFSSYWEVPAGEQTAKNGIWKKGPAEDFFTTMQKELGELPFVAEDLGEIDDPVYQLRDEFQLPGMKVLQFAFGEDMSASTYIPHHYDPNFLVYTGTHDNNTTRGWINQEGKNNKSRIEQYIGHGLSDYEVPDALIRLAYMSVARIAIIPLQDVLNLDENARMNIPASGENNWAWRMTPGQLNEDVENKLRDLVILYGRQ